MDETNGGGIPEAVALHYMTKRLLSKETGAYERNDSTVGKYRNVHLAKLEQKRDILRHTYPA